MTMNDETQVLGSFDVDPPVKYAVELAGVRYQALPYADMEMGQLPALAESVQALAALDDADAPDGIDTASAEVYRHMRVLLAAHIPDLPEDVLDRLTPRVAMAVIQKLAVLE